MSSIVITAAHVLELFRRALAAAPSVRQACPLYLAKGADRTELLAAPELPAQPRLPQTSGRLLVWRSPAGGPTWAELLAREVRPPGDWLCGLEICGPAEKGSVRVYAQPPADAPRDLVRAGLGLPSLDWLKVVGQGLVWVDLLAAVGAVPRGEWLREQGPYSRLIGTLGLPLFTTLQQVHCAVIGAGGTGSALAQALSRYLTSRARLTVIDPDRLADGNLANWSDIPAPGEPGAGLPKAELLAAALGRRADAPVVEPITASVLDWRALSAVKEADLLFCCVDNPSARRAAAFLAALYHKPLIDVGTAVYLGDGPEAHTRHTAPSAPARALLQQGRLPAALLETDPARLYQSDIRLIIPGTGCFFCHGGVGALPPQELAERKERDFGKHEKSAGPRVSLPGRTPFWLRRAGSSYHWNLASVAETCDLALGFLQGELTQSVHRRRVHRLGMCSSWVDVERSQGRDCPGCRLAGTGDAGLPLFGTLSSGG